MKYGDRLEEASVPGWSLHNVDYNSLKHQIKVHTTKDQATTAIAIPGQPNYALRRFENAFYLELCAQHSRVGLFVISKADEVSRRLRHLSGLVSQLLQKCADSRGLSGKRQQRIIRYYARAEECGQDIKALVRFVEAQITAFRKILKKYKKWTGSTTLSCRFKDNVLSSPKSFTNYNFTPLQLQYRELRATLEAAMSTSSDESAVWTPPQPPTESRAYSSRTLSSCRDSLRSASTISGPPTPGPIAHPAQPRPQTETRRTTQPTVMRYWNEYDHGSDAEDQDDTYVIYVDPDADSKFPGLSLFKTMVGVPVDRLRHWLQSHDQKTRGDTDGCQQHSDDTAVAGSPPSETQSLLAHRPAQDHAGARVQDYFTLRGRPHHYTQHGLEHDQVSDINSDDRDVNGHSRANNGSMTEEEEDEGYLSSDEGEHHAMHRGGEEEIGMGMGMYTSAADYEMKQYHDVWVKRNIAASFATGFALLGLSTLLVLTGRHRLRLEVDAGAAAGSAVSLVCACGGLVGLICRRQPSGLLLWLSVWMAFLVLCVLNGVLLVIVAGSTGF